MSDDLKLCPIQAVGRSRVDGNECIRAVHYCVCKKATCEWWDAEIEHCIVHRKVEAVANANSAHIHRTVVHPRLGARRC